MADAAALVPDGARVAFGGLSIYQHPMAFAHELVRQRRRRIVTVGVLNGPELDLLAGAGCVATVETSYVGLERFGLARNFRRAVETGDIRVEDYSEMSAFDRFRASEDGLTFAVSMAIAGTDVAARNPRAVPFSCPITGTRYTAIPAADPDVAVVHAVAADEYGNVLCPTRRLLPQSFDDIVARSSDTVVVTAERIVANSEVRRNPHLTVIPGFRVAAVVEAPYGAHPCHSLDAHSLDLEHFEEYVEASKDASGFDGYLARYVTGTHDHAEYLAAVGHERLLRLRVGVLA
jgi:glutaconate CoA-transferase subunit A